MTYVDRNICDAMEVDPVEWDTDESNTRIPDNEDIIDLTSKNRYLLW